MGTISPRQTGPKSCRSQLGDDDDDDEREVMQMSPPPPQTGLIGSPVLGFRCTLHTAYERK